MKNRKIVPIVILAVVVVSAILYFEVFRRLGGDGGRIEGSGTIEVTEIEISSKIAGRVIELPFDEGARAKKGELVAKLDYDELNAQRLSALANFTNAERNLVRVRELFGSGSTSNRDLDNAETAYRVAKAAYDLVSATIGNAVIYAPIEGHVLERNLEVGEMAFPGSPILTLADLKNVYIKIYVNETKLGFVKPGQKAHVFVDSFPGKPFEGKVTAISNRAEFTPKTIQTKDERVKLVFEVKIAIMNPDIALKPGMPADAVIYTGDEK
ncbi:MAG: efflux RND transporter periplasmic adaptor subunit [Spirochaetes bacterium]|nr:MAG: efflux RND transporter periplasmic adaptor subunit [Spirochaetota bacterium]